jgi:hypothetical protein
MKRYQGDFKQHQQNMRSGSCKWLQSYTDDLNDDLKGESMKQGVKSTERKSVFTICSMNIEGATRRAMRATCVNCGHTQNTVANAQHYNDSGSDEREDRRIGRKFIKEGWEVDLFGGKHICPGCRSPQAIKQQTLEKEHEMEATVVAMPVRGMSREDKRIVFQKISEVYVGEQAGYQPPWTDELVARDLGVPRAWVAEIREEMFGPLASNSDIDDAVKAAQTLTNEMVAIRERSEELGRQAETMLKRLGSIVKNLGAN